MSSSMLAVPDSVRPLESNGTDERQGSYGQILKSSSIIGGSKGANYLISLVRMKVVAIFLGPQGVGLIDLYQSTIGVVSTLSGMGIGSSGVREIAAVSGSSDKRRISSTAKTLVRASIVTGVVGGVLTVAMAVPLSMWTFGTADHRIQLALLGLAVTLNAISVGQLALLQGMRMIKEIACANILSATLGTGIAILVYALFGQRGIVTVIIGTSCLNLCVTYWYTRRLANAFPSVTQTWRATWQESKSLFILGSAFMWGALLAALVALFVRSVIVRDLGLDVAGTYTAAWSISGMFAGFVLSAMATDFYPRLTSVADDNIQVNRLVNEQIEIGVLLSLPGLLATLAFAPWAMRIFYSERFVAGADLLPWFVVGVLFQVVGWPLAFIQRAKGATNWIFVCETGGSLLLLVLSVGLMRYRNDVVGVAIAMPCMYVAYLIVVFLVAAHLSGFRYSGEALRIQSLATGLVVAGFALQRYTSDGIVNLLAGAVLAGVGATISFRGIAARVGSDHRVIRRLCRIPLVRHFVKRGSSC